LRPGVTTTLALAVAVAPRLASTRMADEKRSMERVRDASSWRRKASGTR
jgi:hypothetical protein